MKPQCPEPLTPWARCGLVRAGGSARGRGAAGRGLPGAAAGAECCCVPADFSLFSYNNGVVMTSCRELDSTRSALSAASAFAIATAGANEGTPTKEKYRRMSLASAGTRPRAAPLQGQALWVPISVASGRFPPGAPWLRGQHSVSSQSFCTHSWQYFHPMHPLP